MIDALLTALYAPTAWLLTQPPFISGTALGLLAMITIILSGLVLAKMRFSPLWCLLLMVPYLSVALLWLVACIKWPVERK